MARVGWLLLAFLVASSPVRAHNLEASATLELFWQVRVESWFETGDPARQARVDAFRPDGTLVTTGRLDGSGLFVFTYRESLPLRIVVSAGAGHRTEVAVTAEKLLRDRASVAALCLAPPPSLLAAPLLAPPPGESRIDESVPSTRPPASMPVGRLLLGVAILGLVAVAALVWRKARA